MSVDYNIFHNVLTISPDYKKPYGGIAQVVNTYSKYMKPFYHITSSQNSNKIRNIIILIKSLIKFTFFCLTKPSIKIIHIHSASNLSFYRKSIFLILGKILRKKVIMHIHGGEFHLFYNRNPKFISWILNKSDSIIVLSNQWKVFFENITKNKKIEIIPNIINPPHIQENFKDNKLLTFLFLGKITNKKGIFDLIEVIIENKKSLENKIRLIIGGNGEVEELKEFIVKNKLENIVNYEGWVRDEAKSELFNQSDILILPSYNEGLPISILEAMSYKMPIIASNVGGIPEIVDNKNGVLIEPGNKKNILEAINYYLQNRDLIRKQGKISEGKAEPYLPKNVIKELNNLYTNII